MEFVEQFKLEEFKSLKVELQHAVDESIKLEQYAIGSLGVFYSWFLSQTRNPYIALIAIALVIFGFWRSCLLLKRIEHISEYIRKKLNCHRIMAAKHILIRLENNRQFRAMLKSFGFFGLA